VILRQKRRKINFKNSFFEKMLSFLRKIRELFCDDIGKRRGARGETGDKSKGHQIFQSEEWRDGYCTLNDGKKVCRRD